MSANRRETREARALSKKLGIRYADALRRVREAHTAKQKEDMDVPGKQIPMGQVDKHSGMDG
jgi:hypothetical protein